MLRKRPGLQSSHDVMLWKQSLTWKTHLKVELELETSPRVATCTHLVKQFRRNSCHLPWIARYTETPHKRRLPLPKTIRVHLKSLSCCSGKLLLAWRLMHFARKKNLKKAWSVSVPCWYNLIVIVFVNDWVWVILVALVYPFFSGKKIRPHFSAKMIVPRK